MSAEQLQAFWRAVEENTLLQEKLNASANGKIDTLFKASAVLTIAQDAGFSITAEDLLEEDRLAVFELSDEDLDTVAGGINSPINNNNLPVYGPPTKRQYDNTQNQKNYDPNRIGYKDPNGIGYK